MNDRQPECIYEDCQHDAALQALLDYRDEVLRELASDET